MTSKKPSVLPRRRLIGACRAVIAGLALSHGLLARPALAQVHPQASTANPSQVDSEPEAVQKRIKQLYRDAKAAGDAGDVQKSYELMRELWQLRQSADIAVNLGWLEMKLGRYADAAEHLTYGVQRFPADADERLYRVNKQRLAETLQKVVVLHVVVQPRSAVIRINGKSLGPADELPERLYVEPGAITVEVELEGHAAQVESFTANAGETREVALTLEPAPPPAAVTAGTRGFASTTPLAAPSRPPEPPPRRNLVPVYIAGGLAVVAGGVGVATLVAARDANERGQEQLSEAREFYGEEPCAPSRGGRVEACVGVHEAQNERKRHDLVSKVALGASGVFAVSAVAAYFLWPPSRPDGRVHIGSWVGPGQVGINSRWSF